MDIVDAQVHANMLGTEVTLAVMDALGVQGVLFDEYQRTDGDGAAQPGYRLADGTFRPIGPNAESAALRHPERFAFLMRVDPRDPGIEGALFEDGGYDRLLKAARADSLPLFVTCPGRMLLLAGYAERFPDVQFVIDHCGAAFDSLRGEATIDDAVGMARYPNVAYKWAHAQALLSTTAYPLPDLEPKLPARSMRTIPSASCGPATIRRPAGARTGARPCSAFATIRHCRRKRRPGSWVRTARQILSWPPPQTLANQVW